MLTRIRGSLALITLTAGIVILSGCAQLQALAYKSVDAAAAYCANNNSAGRALVRSGMTSAAVEKDMAIGLRCPGDDEMFVIGDPKTVVSD